jgi:hypothetical protein
MERKSAKENNLNEVDKEEGSKLAGQRESGTHCGRNSMEPSKPPITDQEDEKAGNSSSWPSLVIVVLAGRFLLFISGALADKPWQR